MSAHDLPSARALELLRGAHARLSRPDAWLHRTTESAQDPAGVPCPPRAPEAARWTFFGALRAAGTEQGDAATEEAFERVAAAADVLDGNPEERHASLIAWHDAAERTLDDVLRVLRHAMRGAPESMPQPAVPNRQVEPEAFRAAFRETWQRMATALHRLAAERGGTFGFHEGTGNVESIADLAGSFAGVLYTQTDLPSQRFYLTAAGALGALSGAGFLFVDGHHYFAARLASLASDTFDRWLEVLDAEEREPPPRPPPRTAREALHRYLEGHGSPEYAASILAAIDRGGLVALDLRSDKPLILGESRDPRTAHERAIVAAWRELDRAKRERAAFAAEKPDRTMAEGGAAEERVTRALERVRALGIDSGPPTVERIVPEVLETDDELRARLARLERECDAWRALATEGPKLAPRAITIPFETDHNPEEIAHALARVGEASQVLMALGIAPATGRPLHTAEEVPDA